MVPLLIDKFKSENAASISETLRFALLGYVQRDMRVCFGKHVAWHYNFTMR